LPPSINDGALPLSDVFVVPVPSLGVDRFTDGTQNSDGAEVVSLNALLPKTAEETDCSGSSVEVGDIVLLNQLPVAGWGRVDSKTVVVAPLRMGPQTV
jgi:hypothetical protein